MNAKTLDDINGYEYNWLGCDKSGQIALFSTAGSGYAPGVFLANIDIYDQAIDHILKLPRTTSARAFPKIGEGFQNTWKQVAERGIYSYDADFTDGSYKLVSVPNDAAYVDELPAEIATVIKQFRFSDVLFDAKEVFEEFDIVGLEVNMLTSD